MHLRRLSPTLLLLALLAWRSPALAQDEPEPDLLALGVGIFDVYQFDDAAADFRAEYRAGRGLWWLKPWAGLEVTTDGAVYGLGGLLLDVPLGERFRLTPSAGVGLYHDGRGKDLGHVVEFRTQIELAYRFENDHRLALAFGHISNASLGNRNPGTEILTVYYMIPFGPLF